MELVKARRIGVEEEEEEEEEGEDTLGSHYPGLVLQRTLGSEGPPDHKTLFDRRFSGPRVLKTQGPYSPEDFRVLGALGP